jgi:hypothetical protein
MGQYLQIKNKKSIDAKHQKASKEKNAASDEKLVDI